MKPTLRNPLAALAALGVLACGSGDAPEPAADARPAVETSATRPAPATGAPAAAPSAAPASSAPPFHPGPPGPLGPAAEFVEESMCAACHAEAFEAWTGSDHDRAMEPATAETVLGDFADATFRDASTTTRFLRDGDGFAVETEGADGERARFPVPYVFGVDPLQQVLLETDRGRLQALSVAWDADEGRWYSLYPDEEIDSGDPLHWTKPPHNWNFSCAECHATDLRRNYDASKDAYTTTWHRLDVGCQACHGPAGKHVEWALDGDPEDPERGFDARLTVADSTREIETCARCHARRATLGDGFDHRSRLMDDYLPALLTAGLYQADGQIEDEVYEYGSFLQSKMHARGVRCSDCHEPHSLELRAQGNLMCTTCHSPSPTARPEVDLSKLVRKGYDTPEHHHHAPGTPGSRCVDCHMPERTYMGVDERRDHSFRVPRPDLAAATGASDACSACHDEGSAWAAERIESWYGRPARPPHFGTALAAARAGAPGAAEGLLALAGSEEPPIVRATALAELVRYPSEGALAAFAAGTRDADGLVRHAALGGLELLPPEQRVPVAGPLLTDPLRAVRAEAGRLLVGLPAEALGPFAEAARAAIAEHEGIQLDLLERPEARLNRAQLLAETGRAEEAERELRAAVRLDPSFVPAWVNLAEVARTTKGESEAEGVLRDALGKVRHGTAALHHALGLTLVRSGRREEAMAELARAAELAPEEPRFGYVHAVALADAGDSDAARTALEDVLARHPWHRESRFALAAYREAAGDVEGARRTLAELGAINPRDPGLGGPPAQRPVDPRGRGQ